MSRETERRLLTRFLSQFESCPNTHSDEPLFAIPFSADVGLSLSEAEASIAAPFTSSEENIDCLEYLIRESTVHLRRSSCVKCINVSHSASFPFLSVSQEKVAVL